jgi:dTDP-4-dehydrorhamnose 3,5-epimerase
VQKVGIMSFIFTPSSKLPEVIVIKLQRFTDERGFFSESFRVDEFEKYGIPSFVQENRSRSIPPTFRGLHYQLNPMAQGKLVYCVSGLITDFIVDIRQGSPTYGEWDRVSLNEHNNKMVYVPPGFAHGFFAYGKNDAHVLYKVTNYYSKEHERSIRWSDPDIGIVFTDADDLKISDKDANAPLLKDAENNFHY